MVNPGVGETFGDFLQRAVRRRGWTMARLAAEVGISPSTLSRVRTGRRMPRELPLERWADALALGDEDRQRLHDLWLLAQAPPALRERLAAAERQVTAERERRDAVEHHYAEYRRTQNYHDGFWLAYNASFLDDGSVMRSLCHIDGDVVTWTNMEAGRVQYSYTGELVVLGDKLFIRLAEDRGGAEYVQVTMDSLFDFREPAFLYGLVTGISGKTVHHPISYPAAARMLLLFAGRSDDLRSRPEALQAIERALGTFDHADLGPLYPPELGDDGYLRRCLQLRAREDLDAVLLRMIDNRLAPGQHVLRASFA